MTSPAHGAGKLDARSDARVARIGGVICGRAMAVLALNTGELRRGRLADESRWKLVSHGVAGQAGTVGLATLSHEQRVSKGAGMGGMRHRVENFRVALRADLSSGVLGRWAGDAEEGVIGKAGNGDVVGQIEGCAEGLPGWISQASLLEQLVIPGRAIPRHIHPVGDLSNPCYDGQPRHAPGLNHRSEE